MHEQIAQNTPTSNEDRPETLAETGVGTFDMSMDTVPGRWHDAQLDSPFDHTADGFTNRSNRFNTIPTGQQSSFIGNVAAIGSSFVTGSVWYLCEVLDVYRGPWAAVAMGVVIAIAVRLAGGSLGPSYRAALTVASYLLTLLLMLILITHRELTDIYGGIDGFQVYEQTLVRTRLQDPGHLIAYGFGGFIASQIAYLHRPTS